ncbi:phosphotransferase [Pseudooceanicola sp. C21-150M6]|uniref:phosphotransferase n=1 Tax=Pseudooceanicola sp. C21-150M6 TaxID=3434355 RepID=UPI003D7F51DA
MAIRPTTWSALPGGLTNRLWLCETESGPFVVKLYSRPANPMFDNNAEAEFRVLNMLKGHGVAPDPIAMTQSDAGAIVVYHYLPGQHWHTGTSAAADLLRTLHDISAPQGLSLSSGGSQRILAQTAAIAEAVGLPIPDPVRHLTDLALALPPVPATDDPRLIHGDPVVTNILSTRHGLRLIDWQCPAAGDPCEDIALFLSPAMQLRGRGQVPTDGEIRCFLSRYAQPDLIGRFIQLRPFYHLRHAVYAWWSLSQDHGHSPAGMQAEMRAFESSIGL